MARPTAMCLRLRGKSSPWLWWTVFVIHTIQSHMEKLILEEMVFSIRITLVISPNAMYNQVSVFPLHGHFLCYMAP